MTDIKIVSVDKEESKQNVQPGYNQLVLNLSEAPSEQWRKDCHQLRLKNPKLTTTIKQAEVHDTKMNIVYSATTNMQNLVDELKNLVDATNKGESDFSRQLGELKF